VSIQSDIDIDFGDRTKLLKLIKHVPAAMREVDPMKKHPTGVYITDVPYDPVTDMCSLDYKEADQRGYFKLDLLNVNIYQAVQDELHLISLMTEPNWENLKDRTFVEKLIHLNKQYDVLQKMPEPINSIPRLSMFLAVIRPAKRNLIGQTYKEISKTVWIDNNTGYTFKKSHAVAYAQLVVVHMNLLEEKDGTI
jgi:hypothetical protein|tara:strand:+ start:1822 stop:2403 length:582 start_codon:yes stop_codon:yes gene_type:complete